MEEKAPPKAPIRIVLSILLNLAIFIQNAVAILSYFTTGGDGSSCFMYFTVDSNILAAVISLLLAIWELCHLRGGTPPKWLMLLKFTGTVAVGVTFFTVVLFLGPTSPFGYGPLVTGHNLYLHLLSPLFAMLSLVLLERAPRLRFAETLWGLLPTLIYGVVYFYQVMILGPWKGGWFDFYGFTMGGMWYLSAIGMPVATWLIALGLWALRKLGKKKA